MCISCLIIVPRHNLITEILPNRGGGKNFLLSNSRFNNEPTYCAETYRRGKRTTIPILHESSNSRQRENIRDAIPNQIQINLNPTQIQIKPSKRSGIYRWRNRFAGGTGRSSMPIRIQASQFIIIALNRCSATRVFGTFFHPASKDNPSNDQQRNNNFEHQMPTVVRCQTFPFCTIILRTTFRNAGWKRSGVGKKLNETSNAMLKENAVKRGGIVDLANHSGVTASLD